MPAPAASEPRPPTQDQVLARVVCLGALLFRGFIEQVIQYLDEPGMRQIQMQLAAKLNGWLKAQGFATHLTIPEGESLAQRFGSWSPESIEQRFTRCEEFGVLLWALGHFETLPHYDQPFDFPDLTPILGMATDTLATVDDARTRHFPQMDPEWLSATVKLRSHEELVDARRTADAWMWRAQLAASQLENTPLPDGAQYDQLIVEGTKAALEAGAIDEMLDDDFILTGKPYRELQLEELQQAALIAQARHRALNWLGGYATDWDDVLPQRTR